MRESTTINISAASGTRACAVRKRAAAVALFVTIARCGVGSLTVSEVTDENFTKAYLYAQTPKKGYEYMPSNNECLQNSQTH